MKQILEKYVGMKCYIQLGGLTVGVTILDVKMSYGKYRYLVKPAVGTGEVWVENIII